MALQWINLFDLPGATFTPAALTTTTVEDGVINMTSMGFNGAGVISTGCGIGPSSSVTHKVYIANTAGRLFTGRYRVIFTHATSEESESFVSCRIHRYSSYGGWSGVAPPAVMPSVGVYTYEPDDLPCLSLLDGDPTNGDGVSFHSVASIQTAGGWGAGPCDVRYAFEFEIDYTPPPAPPFWQDFVGCKEIV